MHPVHPLALFRLSVLGPLASRERLERGELKRLIKELAKHPYEIPGSKRAYLSEKTIQHWYYLWRRGGIDALAPKPRQDRGHSKLPPAVQAAILACKKQNPRRSIDTLKRLLEEQGVVARGVLSRSSIHRLLQQHGVSRPPPSETVTERRSYQAACAGDLWYGDVMHGPRLTIAGRERRVYLVSLMDDASRLITHSAFCLGETALDIEGVLKQSLLKRGRPKKLVVDNGAAYRAKSLQSICARLEIRLVYCRAFDPQAKGKLERYHRVFRQQFLSELNPDAIGELIDLNARLWAWVDNVYHCRAHSGLEGATPLQRYQADLAHIRPLGLAATQLDNLFHHRLQRKVRNDATVSYQGQFFEVPYALMGRTVMLVVDPHAQQPLAVESLTGEPLGAVTPLNYLANYHRHRHRPTPSKIGAPPPPSAQHSAVEHALAQQQAALSQPTVTPAPPTHRR